MNMKVGTEWGQNGHANIKGLTYIWLTPRYSGADEQDRTADLLITNQLLYRLSYIGFVSRFAYLSQAIHLVKVFMRDTPLCPRLQGKHQRTVQQTTEHLRS
jgi:hypothetical protein